MNVAETWKRVRQKVDLWSGRATKRTLQTLETGSDRERANALRLLHDLPLSPRDVSALLNLMDHVDAFVRRDIGDMLLARRPKDLLGACLRRVQRSEPAGGLAETIRILGEIADPRAVPAIIPHAQHPSVEVRVTLADALAHFPDETKARDTLALLLKDEHPVVRRATIWALKRIRAEWSQALLDYHAGQETELWIKRIMEPPATDNALNSVNSQGVSHAH